MEKAIALPNETPKKGGMQSTSKLLSLAAQGDKSAIAELRILFNAAPEAWEIMGNLARHAEEALVAVIAGRNELQKEALTRKLASMKEELGGRTPLETLLIERVVACWLQVHYADATFALRMKDLTLAQGDYFQRRQDRAHRRYLSAIRTLAQMRRLLVPAVQVNIGAQQVNVANATACEQRQIDRNSAQR